MVWYVYIWFIIVYMYVYIWFIIVYIWFIVYIWYYCIWFVYGIYIIQISRSCINSLVNHIHFPDLISLCGARLLVVAPQHYPDP